MRRKRRVNRMMSAHRSIQAVPGVVMSKQYPAVALSTLALLLAGCGGGGADSGTPILGPEVGAAVAEPTVSPTVHLAPVLPPEPSDIDVNGRQASAEQAPTRVSIDAALLSLNTAGLSPDSLPSVRRQVQDASKPMASSTVSFYSPAQIRALYGFANLPAASVNKGASQGSGQVIAIINAFHNPTIAADLATFSQKFGLPSCTTVNTTAAMIASGAPVARPAAGSGCRFQVLYANASGAATTTAPAVDKGWATEIALDVQWAHAIAPMASIVLIETPNASSMTAGLTLARKIGANVVSMSFGAREFSGQASYDSLFSSPGVAYVASSGDAGYQVNWPAVSPNVLGVGGTQLSSSTLPRGETGWSGSGGGVSAYAAAPSWQSIAKPLAGTRRAVPDVAYNASPSSAVYVYMSPNSQTGGTGWAGAAGTSAGAPQWAGLAAILNATRAASGKAAISSLPASLYTNIAARPGLLATTMKDVTTGSNGSCSLCAARSGYDLVTGLGSPNADQLIAAMAAL